ncbi:response regulator transcription factor [Sphingomonas sp. RHCKR47]|uniref:LuxR C-terminal-related transcriptional regulator n=1 Tax=Sphingomonas citricola TaxID=2862498 RepID=UPI001C66C8AB|nr:response regulator transcription factor [Sphingomonas citricola]MBW6523758.1 response regulator transcription factor [Sphingomonas citricola]
MSAPVSNLAIVVDDHPMCRQATAMALGVAAPELTVVEAASLAEATERAGEATLMTLDLALPDNRSVLGVPALLDRFPHLRMLVISGALNPDIEQQVAATGAHGYLSKSTPISVMVEAMRAVIAGGTWFSFPISEAALPADSDFVRLSSLTGAQARVLNAMESGRFNKQIAFDLGLSEITVKAHVKAILKKLAVPNRTQAILMLQRAQS